MSNTPRTLALNLKLGREQVDDHTSMKAFHDLAEQLERDAERYRWLRDNDMGGYANISIFFYSPKYPNAGDMTASDIDAAIDAEMTEKTE